MSEKPLDQLENYVSRVALLAQDLRDRNAELETKIDKLEAELEELREESSAKGRDIKNLKHERLELRSRVQRIRKNIAALETQESTL